MPLVTCPDCGGKVSDAAAACIHCGRPMTSGGNQRANADASPTVSKTRTCPDCGGSDVRKVSIVHEGGTATQRGSIVAVTGSGDVGVASTAGRQSTLLAQRLAPPPQQSKENTLRSLGVGCGTGCLSYLVLGGALGIFASTSGSDDASGGVVFFAVMATLIAWAIADRITRSRAAEYNTTVWPELDAKWRRSLICMSCGHIIDPGAEPTRQRRRSS